MKLMSIAATALLACAAAHAQQAPRLGSAPSDGRGNSIANQQQQIEADKYQMRQDKANKDSRKYKKHQRELQRDQEQLQNSTNRK